METKKYRSEKQLLNELKEKNSQLKKQTTSQQRTIERLYNSVVNVKNPYSREKQYQQWAAAENVMDTIIRSAPFQEVKQLLNTTEPIENFYCEHQKNGFMRCSKKCLTCSDDI